MSLLIKDLGEKGVRRITAANDASVADAAALLVTCCRLGKP